MSKFNMGDWEARLVEVPATFGYELWLSRHTPQGREVLTHKGKRVLLKETDTGQSDLYFVSFESIEQVSALADAFANYGLKTVNDHKNEGLLLAKDAHLQDMRALVFKTGAPS